MVKEVEPGGVMVDTVCNLDVYFVSDSMHVWLWLCRIYTTLVTGTCTCIVKCKSGEKRRSALPMLNKNQEKKLAKKESVNCISGLGNMTSVVGIPSLICSARIELNKVMVGTCTSVYIHVHGIANSWLHNCICLQLIVWYR